MLGSIYTNQCLSTTSLSLISCVITQTHFRLYLSLPFSSFIPHTLTPNISTLFTAIPRHITVSPIHYVRYTALLKILHITSGQMCCRAVMIHTDWIINWYFLVNTFLNPWRFTGFATDGISDVKDFTYMCCGFFVSCGQSEFAALFVVFNVRIVPGFIFEPCS